jgi:hypothetical protein
LFAYDFHLPLEPPLSLFSSGGGLYLSWPYGSTGFIVQTTTNAADSTSWSDLASVTQALVGASYQVALPPAGVNQMFYRLRRPQ